jgi:hypothetical protein
VRLPTQRIQCIAVGDKHVERINDGVYIAWVDEYTIMTVLNDFGGAL